MKTFYHSKGPNVKVTFLTKNNAITSITLIEHNQRGCCWQMQYEINPINDWMEAYCEKKPIPFDYPLYWPSFAPFTQSVLSTLATIPFGTFLSYQQLAENLENPKAARAVGNACGRNPFPLLIPCHRILANQGKSLGGFSCGLNIKKTLLNFESNNLSPNMLS